MNFLTIKAEVNICSQKKHEECVESNIWIVNPTPKQIPLVMDEGCYKRVFQKLLTLVYYLHGRMCLFLYDLVKTHIDMHVQAVMKNTEKGWNLPYEVHTYDQSI